MTYPEGTRLVVFDTGGKCFDVDTHPPLPWFAKHGYTIVRESAAKCAEKMLAMLKRIESGATIDDIDSELKALIAAAEGSK